MKKNPYTNSLREYRLLEQLRNRQSKSNTKLSQALFDTYAEWGIIDQHSTPDAKDILQLHDNAFASLKRHALIEMCGIFEKTIIGRLPQALSAAKRTLKEHYKHPSFSSQSVKFVKDVKTIKNLHAISFLIVDSVTTSLFSNYELIRCWRNKAAHGEQNIPIDVDITYSTLLSLTEIMLQ